METICSKVFIYPASFWTSTNLLYKLWCFRYNDIAKYGFATMRGHGSVAEESPGQKESVTLQSSAQTEKPAGLEG